MQNTYDIPNQQWFSGDYSQNNYYPPHLQQQAQDNTHKWFMPAPTLQTGFKFKLKNIIFMAFFVRKVFFILF